MQELISQGYIESVQLLCLDLNTRFVISVNILTFITAAVK